MTGSVLLAEGGVFGKFWEHLSHFTEVNYALPLNFVHMNADIFSDLTDAQQQAIQTHGGGSARVNPNQPKANKTN